MTEITQAQKETLARAMEWRYELIVAHEDWPEADTHHWVRAANEATYRMCPDYTIPGPLHEEMEIKFEIEGYWTEGHYLAWVRRKDTYYAPSAHKRPSAARALAVLAHLEWEKA